MAATVVEKILAKASGHTSVQAGDVVEPIVDLAMSHETPPWSSIGFWNSMKARVVIPVCGMQRKSQLSLITGCRQKAARPRPIRVSFVVLSKAQGISKFHDIRGDQGGICHQVLPESGYVKPGHVIVGTDSHTTSHGALGSFAFGIGATEFWRVCGPWERC